MQMLENIADTARVWIYQSSRPFTDDELPQAKTALQVFARQWTSHNRQLEAAADVLHHRFVILMVDESRADASGCSIDASVRFLQQFQEAFGIDLLNRLNFAYWQDGQVQTAGQHDLAVLYQSGKINDDTLFFDNLVKTKGDWAQSWLKPLSQSWHRRLLRLPVY